MRTWKIACSAAVLAFGVATAAHADEWNKLTMLTFSGPVDMPGMTLPAGTYRFELADPSGGRRVVRVSDKEGMKNLGIFLSIPNERMTPAEKPVVMFQEAAAGTPQAVKAWFYPGETTGYEFVYPQDQAVKIAKATHQPVLSMNDTPSSTTTDAERVASMTSAEISRIDENGRPVSTDAELKESSSQRPSVNTASAGSQTSTSTTTAQSNASTAAQPTTAAPPDPTAQAQGAARSSTAATSTSTPESSTAAQSSTAATTTAQPTTVAESSSAAQPATASTTTSTPTTAAASTSAANPTTAAQPAPAQPTTSVAAAPSPAPSTAAEPAPVGTSGSAPATAARGRKALPRTASGLPLMALLSALALAGGFGLRAARTM